MGLHRWGATDQKKSETVAAAEKQEEESVADEKVLWSVVQNEIYSDGSIKVRRMSGHEFQEVPEIKKPSTRDGSWERKFAFTTVGKHRDGPTL